MPSADSAASAIRILEIRDVISELESRAKALDEMTGRLIDRLSPLVSVSDKKAGILNSPRAMRTAPLAQQIDSANSCFERIADRLGFLLERLEL